MTPFDFLIFGIVSGFSPGPIMALCIGESLKRGARHAFIIPFSIPVANLFIAPAMVITLAIGSQIQGFLGVVPYFGAALLIYLGFQEWQNAGVINLKTVSHPFFKGILMDLLSPFGYLVWLTVLGPTALKVWQENGFETFALYWAFMMSGVVAALLLQIFTAHFIRTFLSSSHIKVVLRGLALILIIFAVKLLL